jgi:hypothetical protein
MLNKNSSRELPTLVVMVVVEEEEGLFKAKGNTGLLLACGVGGGGIEGRGSGSNKLEVGGDYSCRGESVSEQGKQASERLGAASMVLCIRRAIGRALVHQQCAILLASFRMCVSPSGLQNQTHSDPCFVTTCTVAQHGGGVSRPAPTDSYAAAAAAAGPAWHGA